VYKKIDFQLSTNELNIPQDALSFSVYDIEQGEYLFYEGDSIASIISFTVYFPTFRFAKDDPAGTRSNTS